MRITLCILLLSNVRRREAMFETELGSASHLTMQGMLEGGNPECGFQAMHEDCERRRLLAISSG